MNIIELGVLGLYEKYYRGLECAITREEFIDIWWEEYLPNPGDRQFRLIYSKLPICTCEKGGFYPVRTSEILEYRNYLRKKAIPLFNRFKMVCEFHTKLADDVGQMNLFETGENDDR